MKVNALELLTPSGINAKSSQNVNIPAVNSGDVDSGVYSAVQEQINSYQQAHENLYHPVTTDVHELEKEGIYLPHHRENITVEDINKAKANAQGGLEQFGNALVQGGVGVAAIGAAEGFADLYDIFTGAIFKSGIDNLTGTPNEYLYRNKVSEWLLEKRNELNEAFPIYSDQEYNVKNGGLAHWSWYMQNFPSLFSFISFAVPSSATTAFISKGASLAARAVKTANAASRVSKAMKAADIAEDLTKTTRISSAAKAVAKSSEAGDLAKLGQAGEVISRGSKSAMAEYAKVGLNGVLGTFMANQMFAREVAAQEVERLTELFQDDKLFKQVIANDESLKDYANDKEGAIRVIANRAANRDWEWNIITGIPIFSQLYAMRGFWKGAANRAATRAINREARYTAANFGKSQAEIQNIIKNRTFGQKTKDFFKDIDFSFGSAYRGYFDAGWGNAVNVIAENEGKHLTNVLLGIDKDTITEKRLANYVGDGHLWDAAIWGVLGGMFSNALGSAVGSVKDKYINKSQYSEEQARINQIRNFNDLYGNYKIAMDHIKNNEDVFNIVRDDDGTPVRGEDGSFVYKPFENDAEKELAANKLYRQFVLDAAIEAKNVGNYDIIKSMFADDNVKKAFVDAGYVSESEANEVTREAKTIMDQLSASYDRNISIIDALGVDPYINRIISTENARSEVALAEYDKELDVIASKIANVKKQLELSNNTTEKQTQFENNRRAFIIARLTDQLRSLYNEEKRLQSQKKSISRDAALRRIKSAIASVDDYLGKQQLTDVEREFIDYDSRYTYKYKNGKLIYDDEGRPEIEDAEALSKKAEYLNAQPNDVSRDKREGDYKRLSENAYHYKVQTTGLLGSKELTDLENRKIFVELNKSIVQSQINSSDRDILERAAEIEQEIMWEAGLYDKNAANIIQELMTKYEPNDIYNYADFNDDEVFSSELTKEDKAKLDDALAVLKLRDFGHGSLLDKIGEMRDVIYGIRDAKRVMEEAAKAESEIKKEPAPNPEATVVPPPPPAPSKTYHRAAPGMVKGIAPTTGEENAILTDIIAKAKEKPDYISTRNYVFEVNTKDGVQTIDNIYLESDNTYTGSNEDNTKDYNFTLNDIVGLVQDATIPYEEFKIYDENYSTVSELLNFENNTKVPYDTVPFANGVKSLLKNYIKQHKDIKSAFPGKEYYTISYADFIKFLYESRIPTSMINSVVPELNKYFYTNNTIVDEEVVYDIDLETNNETPRELYNYIRNSMSKPYSSFLQKLTFNTMAPVFDRQGDKVVEYIANNVKVGDKITFRQEGNNIVFIHKGRELGLLPIPAQYDNGTFEQINDLWTMDVNKEGNQYVSHFIDLFSEILNDDVKGGIGEQLRDILQEWTKHKAEKYNSDYEKEKAETAIIEKFKNWLSPENVVNNELLKYANGDIDNYNDVYTMLNGLYKLFRFGVYTDNYQLDLWKQKTYDSMSLMYEMSQANKKDYEIKVSGLREGSLYIDPNALKTKETRVDVEELDEIDLANQPNLENESDEGNGRGTIHDRLIGLAPKKGTKASEFKSPFRLGVTTDAHIISVSGETVGELFDHDANKKGRTYILFPDKGVKGRSYANFYPAVVDVTNESKIGKNAKNIVLGLQNTLYDLIYNNVTVRDADSYEALAAFLKKVFNTDTKNKKSLFGLREDLVTPSEQGQLDRTIIYVDERTDKNEADKGIGVYAGKVRIEEEVRPGGLYIPFLVTGADGNLFRAQVANFDNISLNLSDIAENEDTQNRLKFAIANFFEKMQFDIPFNFVLEDNVRVAKQSALVENDSIVSRGENGEFIITVPSTGERQKTYTYKSFSDFILYENLGETTIGVNPITGTNFVYTDNLFAQPRVEFTVTNLPRSRNGRTYNEIETILKTDSENDGDKIVGRLLYRETQFLQKPEHFEIYPAKVKLATKKELPRLFKNKNGVIEANAATKNGIVYVGEKFMNLISETGKTVEQIKVDRNRAVRLLIHERLHQLIKSNDGNIQSKFAKIKEVYDEFLESIDDDANADYLEQIANNNNTDINAVKDSLKTYGFDDDLHKKLDDRIEEFLIESITNKELSSYLNNVTAKDVGIAGVESLWQKLMRWLLQFLGIDDIKKGSLYEKEFNALSDIMSETTESNVTDETNAQQEVERALGETNNDSGFTNEQLNDMDSELEGIDEDESTANENLVISEPYVKSVESSIVNIPTMLKTTDMEYRTMLKDALDDGLFNVKCKI